MARPTLKARGVAYASGVKVALAPRRALVCQHGASRLAAPNRKMSGAEAGSSSAHATEDEGAHSSAVVLTHSIDDDELFRALAGDVEAAKAVQERQQRRRLQRAAPSFHSQPVPVPVPATAAPLTPRESSESGALGLKLDCSSLLEHALSGACTWLYTQRGVSELVMPLKQPPVESAMTLVRKLDERRSTAEELKTELARRDEVIHQGRRTLDAMREEYEALQARMAEARTEEGRQRQQAKMSA